MDCTRIPASTPSQESAVEKLPDEILDEIIQDVGPVCSKMPMLLRACGRDRWLPCSMVCRRWYQIAIPYLFRLVEIDSESPGSTSDFCDMVSRNASVAHAVHGIAIEAEELHMDTIVSLLKHLPCLRYLDIFADTMHRNDNPQKPFGHYNLEKLTYESQTTRSIGEDLRSYEEYCFQWEVAELLQLFDNIGELELGSDDHRESYDNIDEAIIATGKPHIGALKLVVFEYDVASYLTGLHKAHVFDHLTCLSILCNSLLKIASVSRVLLYVGRTLEELYLYFNVREDHYGHQAWDEEAALFYRNSVIQDLRGGIAACRSLHGFRLHIDSSYNRRRHFLSSDYDTLEPEEISQVAVTDWSLALDIFSLVAELHCRPQPNGGHIRHIAFSYNSHQWRNEGQGFEILPWARMREVFRRFINLTTITVIFKYKYYEREKDISDSLGETLGPVEYTTKEMQEFGDMLFCCEPLSFFLCTQGSCRWHISRCAHYLGLELQPKDWRLHY